MTRLPRDLGGAELVKRLQRLGYRVVRQTGSHIRLTCELPQPHHVTIPAHDPLRIGTLAVILADIARHHKMTRDELVDRLES
ncbi:MAG: type II toxin-antitoxin system HicA family toxin [Proteobacteria bacterium]|nr:type II toxin-antitoxin system HicA family toxin [Pseudomonadota bacterium]